MKLPSNVDWNLLRNLNICSRHKNFNEAAKEAGVLPPAFSKQLRKLEQQLGVELFERVNGNACNKLTPIGFDLLKKTLRAEKLFYGKEEENFVAEEEKDIKIYTTHGISSTILPTIVNLFLEENPMGTVHVITNFAPPTIEPDSILIRTDFRLQKDIEKIKLIEMEMAFYASEEYIKKYGNPKTFLEAYGHNFLFSFGNRFLEKIAGPDTYISPLITSTDIIFSYGMCLKGKGILELPTIYRGSNQLIRVLKGEPTHKESLFVGCCNKRMRTTAVSLFIRVIKELIETSNPFDKI